MKNKYLNIILLFLIIILSIFFIIFNFYVINEKKYLKKEMIDDFKRIGDDRGRFLSLLLNENDSYPDNEQVMTDYTKEIKFLFFGDLMLDRNVKNKIDKYGLDYLLEELKNTNFTYGYDVIACNLEGTVSDGGQHYLPDNLYDFAFAPELISQLKNYYFNYLSVANNHLSDQGNRGIEETYKNLSSENFYYSGCRDAFLSPSTTSTVISWGDSMPILNEANCSDIILKINGQKVAMLSISAVYEEIDQEEILNRIKKLKSESDWLIVNSHIGIEYQTLSSKKQRDLYRAMIDAGADAIIGHHPHVAQEYEIYKEKPIFYSLGNFIFDQYFSAETQSGLAIALIFKVDKSIDFNVYQIRTEGSKLIEIIKIEKTL